MHGESGGKREGFGYWNSQNSESDWAKITESDYGKLWELRKVIGLKLGGDRRLLPLRQCTRPAEIPGRHARFLPCGLAHKQVLVPGCRLPDVLGCAWKDRGCSLCGPSQFGTPMHLMKRSALLRERVCSGASRRSIQEEKLRKRWKKRRGVERIAVPSCSANSVVR